MDTFTFMVSVLLMFLAIQYGQTWIVFGIVAIMILSMRSISTTILLIISAGAMYWIKSAGLDDYMMYAVIALIAISLVFGFKTKSSEPDMYGGLGGGGGYGGLLGGY